MDKQIQSSKEVPNWASHIVSNSDLDEIEKAVSSAEKGTSGEIVPMIVRSSVTTGHVKPLLFLFLLAVLWGFVPFLEAQVAAPEGFWTWVEFGILVFAGAMTMTISNLGFIQRLFTTKEDQIISCERRALLEFYEGEIGSTLKQTGVLIMVSVLERRAVILADKTIAEKLPASTWTEIIHSLIDETKGGRFSEGMCAAIASTGKLLAEHFPLEVGDRNELGDRLLIKE